MPTPSQIRAARGLLDWSQKDLAERAGVTEATVRNTEKKGATPNSKTLDKISRAFDLENIDFIGDRGIEERRSDIQKYTGRDGFKAFIWDVYETVKEHGGEICVSNVDETSFTKALGKENDDAYMDQMQELIKHQPFQFKILIKEGDRNFVASSYAQYKWVSEEFFFSVPFYVYGEKLAFILLDSSSTIIYVIHNSDIALAQRAQFNLLWAQAINPHPVS